MHNNGKKSINGEPIDMEQEITVNASYLKEMISQMDKKEEFHERTTENLLTGILKQIYPGINTLERLPINNTIEKLAQVITPMVPAINRQCYRTTGIPEERVIEKVIGNAIMNMEIVTKILAYIAQRT